VSSRLPFVLALWACLAALPRPAAAAAGSDPIVTVSVPPGYDFRQGEGLQVNLSVALPADAPGDVTARIDAFGMRDGFVRRMYRWEFDCGDRQNPCPPCPPGRACFFDLLTIDVRAPLGRMTLPITIVDALGRETRTAASFDVHPSGDRDGDGLPDAFEDFYQLSFRADGGPNDDPNGNGVTNLEEYRRGTNPRVRYTRYFAEASTGDRAPGVEQCLNVAALRREFAHGVFTLIGDDGRRLQATYGLGDRSITLCHLDRREHVGDRVVAVVIESDIPFTAERVVVTPDPTAEPFATPAVDAPSRRWFFADGGADGVMDAFYLAYNPNGAPVEAEFTYRRADGSVARRRTAVLPPGVRTTTWVNADDAPLGRSEAWVEIAAGAPILVERAWRFDPPGRTVTQQYASAGTAETSSRWFFPEVDGQAGYDTTIQLANPSPRDVVAEVSLLFAGRTERKAGQVRIPAGGRVSLPARAILPDGRGAVEIVSTDGVGIVAERTTSGRDAKGPWRIAAVGAGTAGPRWTIANDSDCREVVVTNVSAYPARVEMHFGHSYGFDNDVVTTIDVPARQRFVYPLDPGLTPRLPWIDGTLRVTSQATDRGTADLVVESLRYADVDGVERARASGLIGARVP